ncbi:MAG TPA: hypothetical protein VMU10_10870 [Desulfomonilia bacterium]|nr:hypothetical protein [Desulfomonilia bacterium]
MKKFIMAVMVGSFVLLTGLNAHAFMASYTSDEWMSFANNKSADTFTLKSSDFKPGSGFMITEAILSLSFKDADGPFHLFNYAMISDGASSSWHEVKNGTMLIPLSKDGINKLNTSGQLTFTLTRLFGCFTFSSAKLTAETSQVPIPATLWLFGPALIGYLVIRKQFCFEDLVS